MRAVRYSEFGQEPSVVELPDLVAPPGGVVVDVEATGVCRSDWHGWKGHDDGITLPHVPGHELVGRIRSVGDGVVDWSVGQRCTVPFVCGCGSCELCRSGNAQVCPNQEQPGFTYDGSWAQQVVLHAADFNLVAIPEQLPPEAVVSLGCRFATAYRALAQRAQVREGELVAVFGCGGVGLSAVMIAAALGGQVIAVDINPDALQLALRHGATHVVDSRGLDVEATAQQVRAVAGRAPAVTVEALGLESTLNAALRSLAPLGRHAQIGLFDGDPRAAIGPVIAGEIAFFGSHGMAAADYTPMLQLVIDGKLRPQELVTKVIDLDDAPAAMMALEQGTPAGMTIIRP